MYSGYFFFLFILFFRCCSIVYDWVKPSIESAKSHVIRVHRFNIFLHRFFFVGFIYASIRDCLYVCHFQNIFALKLTLNCCFLHFCHCFVSKKLFYCNLFTVPKSGVHANFCPDIENYCCRYRFLLTSFKSRIWLRKYLHNLWPK